MNPSFCWQLSFCWLLVGVAASCGLADLFPFHDKTVVVTTADVCACIAKRSISAPAWLVRAVGIKEVHDGIWLVSFMDYDLGYIDLEEKTLQPLNNPFGPKVLTMS